MPDEGVVLEQLAIEIAIKRVVVVGKIGDHQIEEAVAVLISEPDAHAAL